MIIAGMALLFPTAFVFYLGVKMVFAAYREYRKWRDARVQAARDEGRAEGRDEERARMKRELKEQGISLPPEAEQALFGETDAHS